MSIFACVVVEVESDFKKKKADEVGDKLCPCRAPKSSLQVKEHSVDQ